MAVSQANKVPRHGADCCGACVCEALLKPCPWLPEVLQEEVVHAGDKPCADLLISKLSDFGTYAQYFRDDMEHPSQS